MTTLSVKIITPAGEIFHTDDATVANIMTLNGGMGLLANHEPILAALEIGPLTIKSADADEIFAVSGGFAEFSNNTLTVIADTAENAANIDVTRAQAAQERAKIRLESVSNDDREAKVAAELALRRAINRLQVSNARSTLGR